MFKGRIGSKKNKIYEDIPYSCTIRFLDDNEPISVTYQKETKGQWLIDYVCKELNLVEKDYFGLRYVDAEKQRHWLDPWKPVYKQLKNVNPVVLCFRVKFYPTDPMKLKEEITRYFLFLQLRRDLHHGRLLCSPADANLLAAYIVQSEVGDYDPEDHAPGYVSQFKMLPKQTTKQEEKIADLHKTLTTMVPSEAEGEFLKKAAQLDTYGVDPHPVKDQKGNQMYLGVTHLGIVTFQGNKRTHLFKWPQITKIAFEGKMFIVHVTISEGEENSLLVKRKKHACGFKCPTYTACKHLWKCAVEQQYFFTLQTANDAPKVTSGGGIFTRGSKFRFSGRCQKEVYSESQRITREEPPFNRSVSNPQLVRSINAMRSSASLPGGPGKGLLKEKNFSSENNIVIENNLLLAAAQSLDLTTGAAAITEELEDGPPAQTHVQVSDVPYDPLQSPSTEALPTFPTDAGADSDGPRQGATAAPPPPRDLDTEIKQLTAELEKSRVDLGGGEMEAGEPSPPLTATPPPDTAASDPPPPADTHNHNGGATGVNNGSVTAASPAPAVQPPPPISQRSIICCKALTLSFFFLFFVMTVITICVLESELDVPVLKDIRQMPEVQDFKSTHYNPFKTTVMQKMGRWYHKA